MRSDIIPGAIFPDYELPEHNDEMPAENERIVWAAVSERTCLCRMHMTLS